MTAGELFGLAACAVCAAALGAVVKRSSREHALLLAAVTAVLLLLAALEGADPLLRELEGLSAAFPGECFPVMLKAVGITIAGQLAAQLCKDAGESALAHAVELAAKAAVLAAAFPLLRQLFDTIGEILRLCKEATS